MKAEPLQADAWNWAVLGLFQDMGEWPFPWALCTCGRRPGFSPLEEELCDEPRKNDAG